MTNADANLTFDGNIAGVEELIISPQTITDSWTNLGDEFDFTGARRAALWLDLEINDSENIRLRLLVRLEDEVDLHELPIKAITNSDVKVKPHYYELSNDIDQKIILDWTVGSVVYFGQIQVMAGVVGSTPARALQARLTTGN